MSDLVERLRTSDIYDYAAADKICREAAARIAELEAAIYQYVNHVVSYEGISFIDEMSEPPWAKLINDTWVKQAALAGEKEKLTPKEALAEMYKEQKRLNLE